MKKLKVKFAGHRTRDEVKWNRMVEEWTPWDSKRRKGRLKAEGRLKADRL